MEIYNVSRIHIWSAKNTKSFIDMYCDGQKFVLEVIFLTMTETCYCFGFGHNCNGLWINDNTIRYFVEALDKTWEKMQLEKFPVEQFMKLCYVAHETYQIHEDKIMKEMEKDNND